jgi:hypothetical protein
MASAAVWQRQRSPVHELASPSRVIREKRIEGTAPKSGGQSTSPRQPSPATSGNWAPKQRTPGGSYANPSKAPPARPGQCPTCRVSVGAGPLIVIKTATGGAPAVAAALDQAGWKEIIGTLAGDDTLLVIARNPRMRQLVEARLAALAR